jgi:UDP-hydrolysing UDP-N-acetyl-D-glucosamine 2-epimerase
MNRKIAVFVGSRANWGRLRSVCKAIKEHDALELQLILGASFYNAEVEYPVASRIQCLINSDDHEAMALTTGVLLTKVSMELQRIKPDIVLVHGDRYEVLAVAQASAYQNIPLAHTEGGEVTGCIDDKVRNAITALADIHFPVTEKSSYRLSDIKLWYGSPEHQNIFVVGSTALDGIRHIRGIERNHQSDYIVVLFHPNTTSEEKVDDVVEGCNSIMINKIWINPNVDAGNKDILHYLHKQRWEYAKNLSPEEYAKLIYNSACVVGNSSSFVKEASFLGVPAVLVGERQRGREKDSNVIEVANIWQCIAQAIDFQKNRVLTPSNYFGDGTASEKIANILAEVEL